MLIFMGIHISKGYTNAGFKCMFWNHVFCPIVLYTNPSWAGCVSPHLRRATFLSFDIKTIAKMRRKPQHVGNVRADVPYMLRFSSHFCNGFYIKWQKMWRDVIVWSHIQLRLDLYTTRWDKIHDSKTCVWTQYNMLDKGSWSFTYHIMDLTI